MLIKEVPSFRRELTPCLRVSVVQLRQIIYLAPMSPLKTISLIATVLLSVNSIAQNPVNWTDKQLLQPSELANSINTKQNIPVIISVGPGAVIPNSVDVGMVNNADGLKNLRTKLKGIDRKKKIVIYCGCCPFEHCPNVRPAIAALKELKFTNYYLLNIPANIKKDWIDKGYPVAN